MGRFRTAMLVCVALTAAALALSGGERADPRTPRGPAGLAPPFLGTAVVGSGRLTAAIDPYGSVVDLRPAGPAGPALVEVDPARLAAGTVPAETGITVAAGAARALPLWEAEGLQQRYLPGSNVLVTAARAGPVRVEITDGAVAGSLQRRIAVRRPGAGPVVLRVQVAEDLAGRCHPGPGAQRRDGALQWHGRRSLVAAIACGGGEPPPVAAAWIAPLARRDRIWAGRAMPLGPGAPGWARRLYGRSLLALRALTDRDSGAVVAGARAGWAFVWPRDAAAAALAYRAAGLRPEGRRVASFLSRLDPGLAARFGGDAEPIAGRPPQGDGRGWIAAALRANGVPPPPSGKGPWRDRGDYGERSGDRGDYLANAIAAGVPAATVRAEFATPRGLVRVSGDPGSALDSAAAWAVRPFPRPSLFAAVERTLLRLMVGAGPYGIQPSSDWPGAEAWTAPTAWTAWSLAALGERRRAIALVGALRRAATGAGALPERLNERTGVPASTTPLAWSHAFAVLALRELWPAEG